ncbi:hypothetical protein [Desulfogranum japonicum]|uniref:hypothetical protein n=1 Tax=Desulfogranum japonicum TaxID=231447 RepID=UPI00048C97A5|nr:hypothetical protein [Desulfogranum japonicum]
MTVWTALVIGLSWLSAIGAGKRHGLSNGIRTSEATPIFQLLQTGAQPTDFFSVLRNSVLHEQCVSGKCTETDEQQIKPSTD